jgi:hypothetical protein
MSNARDQAGRLPLGGPAFFSTTIIPSFLVFKTIDLPWESQAAGTEKQATVPWTTGTVESWV